LAHGTIHFKPPHLLRVEQETPRPEAVITDGRTLWWYIPQKRQVYRYPSEKLGQELQILSDVFQGLKGVEESFVAVLTDPDDKGRYRIELRPEPPWPEVTHILLTVEPDTWFIRVIEIHNPLGGFTRFTLGAPEPREHFDEDFFSFKVPDGVRVIEE
ncbi:MAG: outer membrane lipoprotein carrier protein LolA, partial [Deltaproteobacteria bacterium]|nr:outer membrane lipoprotein carrier protein LolA [Deltaproteobacteria bacterium]